MDAGADAHKPLPWRLRAGAMPWLPGSAEECLPRLRQVIDLVDAQHDLDEAFTWAVGLGQTTLRAALRGLGRSGLFTRSSQSGPLELTSVARAWREGDDDTLLIRIFHANVKFVGELLACFSERMTHDDIRQAAKKQYGIDWKTLDQVRRRTNWFRAVGAMELWSSNELVLLEPSDSLLSILEIEPPLDLASNNDSGAVTLGPSAGPHIRQLLEELDESALTARSRAVSYIPGGDTVSVLHQLVSTMETKVSREAFEEICSREFSIAESSARTALSTLRAAGLVEQVGPNHFCATDIAQEWLETEDPIDLVRIFHANFVFVGEILEVLETTSRNSGEIRRHIAQSYDLPMISQEEVARRLRLLKSAGLVEELSNQVRLTPAGRALGDSLPMLKPSSAGSEPGVQARIDQDQDEPKSGTSARSTEARALSRELQEASLDSANYVRFEKAVERAMQFLGFTARHIGGPSNTDVLVDCWLAPGTTRRVAIDAKSTSSGVLDDLKFPALEEHRKRHGADQTAVIASSFDARLAGWADDQNVLFIEVATLARWVMRHSVVAFKPADAARLLQRDGEDELEAAWTTVAHQYDVLREVAHLLWSSANNSGHVAKSGGSFTPREVWLLMMSTRPEVEEAEITEALHLLASPLIGAVSKKGNGSFSAARSPDNVSARLAFAAAAVLSETATTIDEPAAPPSSRSIRHDRKSSSPRIQERAVDPRDVRAWAKSQGLGASERGRLPKGLVERYLESQR